MNRAVWFCLVLAFWAGVADVTTFAMSPDWIKPTDLSPFARAFPDLPIVLLALKIAALGALGLVVRIAHDRLIDCAAVIAALLNAALWTAGACANVVYGWSA